MQLRLKTALAVIFLVSLPAALSAQSDICRAPSPSVPAEARGEQLRIQAEERSRQELTRSGWTSSILPVKYATTATSLQPLCIFGVEVVPQPAMKLVAIRAPKELMPAIEEALKRLDVPAPAAKTVEMTGYVLAVSDRADSGLMPIPSALQSVADQLKNVIPNGTLYLADTIVVRGTAGEHVRVQGANSLQATINVREDTPPVVQLTNLYFSSNIGASFNTDVTVPVGAHVIVGRASTTNNRRPVVLVINVKLLD